VTGPGQLSFWWKISSEQNYDYLRFYLDAQEQPQKISGTVDWQLVSMLVGNGAHSLRWAYTKDVNVAGGMDAGWVDEVSFVPRTCRLRLPAHPLRSMPWPRRDRMPRRKYCRSGTPVAGGPLFDCG